MNNHCITEILPMILRPEQIHSPDENARADGQTDGQLDLLILKKFILNSRDIFNSQIQDIYNHVNAKHAIP